MNFKSLKEKLKMKNRRDQATVQNDDRKSSLVDEYVKVDHYSAVSSSVLVYSQSLNSSLSLLIGNYETMKQLDRVVDIVETLIMILGNQDLVTLEQLWGDLQQGGSCLALRTKLTVQVLKLMANLEGFTWEQVKKMQMKVMVFAGDKNRCKKIITEEKVHESLVEYNQIRVERNRTMGLLDHMFSRLGRIIRKVAIDKEPGSVPDIDGCLRDCNSATGEISYEELENMMHPVLEAVMDRSMVVVDMVEKIWEELGMDDKLKRISCNERGKNGNIKKSLRVHKFQVVDTGLNSGGMSEVGETSPGRENLLEILDGHEKSVADEGCRGDVSIISTVNNDVSLYVKDVMPLSDCRYERISLSDYSCEPLGSSTPRRMNSLPQYINQCNDNTNAMFDEESDRIEIKELLALVEQGTGIMATQRLKAELDKLSGGFNYVNWKKVERILDFDPDILFTSDQ